MPAENNGQSEYLIVRTAAEDRVVSSEILPPPIRRVNENHVVRLKLADASIPSYFTDEIQIRVMREKKKASEFSPQYVRVTALKIKNTKNEVERCLEFNLIEVIGLGTPRAQES